jgi:hypothetical protein
MKKGRLVEPIADCSLRVMSALLVVAHCDSDQLNVAVVLSGRLLAASD